MSTYNISRNDDAPIPGVKTFDLSEAELRAFLLKADAADEAYLYSVGERDEDDDFVARMNGQEWLAHNPSSVVDL